MNREDKRPVAGAAAKGGSLGKEVSETARIYPSEVRGLTIRSAARDDAGELLRLIGELAEYEKLTALMSATEDAIKENLFDKKGAEALIAELEGEVVGYAIFFGNFSTFLAKSGIYLEDLYVSPKARGKGIGKALLLTVKNIAAERGCGRLEWSCLDWNTPSLEFYKSFGAVPLEGWLTLRIEP